jgi:hypothetical protein
MKILNSGMLHTLEALFDIPAGSLKLLRFRLEVGYSVALVHTRYPGPV